MPKMQSKTTKAELVDEILENGSSGFVLYTPESSLVHGIASPPSCRIELKKDQSDLSGLSLIVDIKHRDLDAAGVRNDTPANVGEVM